MRKLKPLFGCSILIIVSACGATVNGPNATYHDFGVTAPVTSQLSGKAFGYSDMALATPPIGDASGTLQHDTRATTLTSAGVLSDADGPDGNGDLADDANTPNAFTTATFGNNNFSGNYDFVTPFTQTYGGCITCGSGTAVGFIGMATAATDIPSAGNATFTGEAVGTSSATGNWTGNSAVVTANFGSGMVDVTTSNTANGIVENISLTGMAITGNELSGGALNVTHNGIAVDATSFGLRTGGQFYGYDTETGGPDEVGVLFSNAGTDTAGTMTILAD